MGNVIKILCISMILYQLIATQILIMSPTEHQNLHLILSLLIVFLTTFNQYRKTWILTVILIIISLITTGYIFYYFSALEQRMGVPTTADIIIGIMLLVVCWEASRRALGWVLPLVGLTFIIYTFFGHYLPVPFWHYHTSLSLIISKYNIGLSGMFGQVLGISANYLFLFMVFGSFLEVAGGSKFFIELSKMVGKRLKSGPAFTAIFSSALVGSLTGSGAANVGITGPFTIPAMKKAGYTPEMAGAIEAVASTGGALVPPIMGVAAFIMAEYLRISYLQVCLMSIIPALLYYFSLFTYVQLNASKMNISCQQEKVNLKEMIGTSYIFIVPLIAIIWLLMKGYTLRMVSFAIVVLVIVLSLIRKETRVSSKAWIDACVKGASIGAKLAVTTAIVGIVLASFDVTGIGLKFPAIIGELSGGNLFIALLLVGCCTILLGCGIPPFATYIIVAMLCAPVLVKLGVTPAQAHYFCFVFAVFAHLTPPVAISALTASVISGASYTQTAIQSVKAGFVAWLLPFMVIWVPMIILQPQELFIGLFKLFLCVVMIIIVQAAFAGYFILGINNWERILLAACGLAIIIFLFVGTYQILVLGLIILSYMVYSQTRKKIGNY